MLHKLALSLLVLALMACTTTGTHPSGEDSYGPANRTTTYRLPAIETLHLIDGLNLVDRAPSGMTLSAHVNEGKITEWRVVNEQGPVAFDNQPGDDDFDTFCQDFAFFGGDCKATGDLDTGETFQSCCLPDYGCYECMTDDFVAPDNPLIGICFWNCDANSEECWDNQKVVDPGDPMTPIPRSDVAVLPDLFIITIEPKTADPKKRGWSLTDVTGARMHVPTLKKTGMCPICTTDSESKACWVLPCLPAEVRLQE